MCVDERRGGYGQMGGQRKGGERGRSTSTTNPPYPGGNLPISHRSSPTISLLARTPALTYTSAPSPLPKHTHLYARVRPRIHAQPQHPAAVAH